MQKILVEEIKMRIACMSDIHANYPALEAVVDDIKSLGDDVTIIVAGDMINNGPFPKETLGLIRQLNPIIIKGNHEDYVLNTWKGLPVPVPFAINAPVRWTISQLTQDDLEWLNQLPDRVELQGPDGWQIITLHASPSSNMRGVFPFMTDEQLAARFASEPIIPKKFFLCGHVHQPVLRRWQGMLIGGDGSVGQPMDNNSAACYLFAEWDVSQKDWRVEHRRVVYDRSVTLEAMQRNCDYEQSGPIMKLLLKGFIEASEIGYPTFLRDYIKEGSWATADDPLRHLDIAVEKYLAQLEQHGKPEFALLN